MEFVTVNIREMEEKDLPSVLEIENACFIDPWKRENYIYEMTENPVSCPWVVELSSSNSDQVVIAGYCIYWHTFDSATICKIAVHPAIQKRQLGSAMMDEIINDCYAKKVAYLTLEVRKSNYKAISFYEKHGFKKELVKERYYSNGEDAIYMIRRVDIL